MKDIAQKVIKEVVNQEASNSSDELSFHPAEKVGAQNSESHAESSLIRSFLQRENTLVFMHQLNQLVKCAQRYRGLSLGVVSGSDSFKEGFSKIESELERRLITIEAFAHSMDGLLVDKEKENLKLAWNTVRHDWQNDGLEDNFELHTHFVEQVLALTVNLSNRLKQPLWEATDTFSSVDVKLTGYPKNLLSPELTAYKAANEIYRSPQMFRQIEVLDFVVKSLLTLIECLAKIRGLASYAAAVGSSSGLNGRKLRFLLTTTRAAHEKVLQQSSHLSDRFVQDMPSLETIKPLELKVLFLLNTVEGDVLSAGPITSEPQHLFDLATDVISVYWSVVNDGLGLIRTWHSESLDDWCRVKL